MRHNNCKDTEREQNMKGELRQTAIKSENICSMFNCQSQEAGGGYDPVSDPGPKVSGSAHPYTPHGPKFVNGDKFRDVSSESFVDYLLAPVLDVMVSPFEEGLTIAKI